MESYMEFAKFYDKLMGDVNYKKWFSYIEEILHKYEVDSKDILEMACGTGNLTYFLCSNGYNVTGFDFSEDMLSIAYNKLCRFRNVHLLKQNMVDFNINKKFNSIISICDSINYITDESDLYNTFSNVYRHLKDGGIFIFDINSYYKLNEIIGENTFVEDGEDIFYVWQNYFDSIESLCEFYLTFFIKNSNGLYSRFEEEHIEKAYSIDKIEEILKKANFSEVCFYDAFTFNKPNDKSERINFVARK